MSTRYDTVWEIKEAIKSEKHKLDNVVNSAQQWRSIVEDINSDVTNLTTSGHEWQIRYDCQHFFNRLCTSTTSYLQFVPSCRYKVLEEQRKNFSNPNPRYDCQHLYNRMMQKQLRRMRAELRMLRYGIQLPEKDDVNYDTVGDWRHHLKHMRVEKCSLQSLQRMYDRQLDAESMEYFRSRDLLLQMTKDVKNCRQAWMRAQEKIDEETLTFTELRGKKQSLKPVAKIIPIFNARKKKQPENYSQRYHDHRVNGGE